MTTRSSFVRACMYPSCCFLMASLLGACAAEAPPAETPQNPPAQPNTPPPPVDAAPAAIPVADASQDPYDGDDDVSVDDFREPLSAYGSWFDVDGLGRVWQPADDVVGSDFTPYASGGQWVVSDDGVWTFQTADDSQWAWAAYHYGRWNYHDDYGWVWAPGTQWAPAWVEWRYGGGYVGWAPAASPGFTVAEPRWMFVEEANFVQPGVYAYRLPYERAHVAYTTAAPIVEVRGRARCFAGPPVATVRSHGVAVRPVRRFTPARGGIRVFARATARAAAPRIAARAASAHPVRRGSASAATHPASAAVVPAAHPAAHTPAPQPAAASHPTPHPAATPAPAAAHPAVHPVAAPHPAPAPAAHPAPASHPSGGRKK